MGTYPTSTFIFQTKKKEVNSQETMISIQNILLVACVAFASATQYNLEFEENGSKYNERIIVDTKKGFLLYDVPKHGDIAAAKFLKDFNIRLNVLRDAALKICSKSFKDISQTTNTWLKMTKFLLVQNSKRI